MFAQTTQVSADEALPVPLPPSRVWDEFEVGSGGVGRVWKITDWTMDTFGEGRDVLFSLGAITESCMANEEAEQLNAQKWVDWSTTDLRGIPGVPRLSRIS